MILENNRYRTAADDDVLLLIANAGKGLGVKKKANQIFLICFPVGWNRRDSNPRPNTDCESFLHAYFIY